MARGQSSLGQRTQMQYVLCNVDLEPTLTEPAFRSTLERVEKGLGDAADKIERFACDQHDCVSFAKAWMLMSKGIAHVLGLLTFDWSHRRVDGGRCNSTPSK